MERRIYCPKCRADNELSVVTDVRVRVDIDARGNQRGGADFGAEGYGRWLCCGGCGHSWRTARTFDLRIDVR